MLFSYSAYATNQDVVKGCDPKVMDVANKKGAARLAADVAVMEQLYKKPRSVLELICFNKIASVAAKKGGEIFSGDFTEDIKETTKDALRRHYENFDEGAEGKSADVDLTANKYECDKIKKAWEAEMNAGIDLTVPTIITDEALTKDEPPKCRDISGGAIDCGEDFRKSWEASAKQNIFKDYKEAVEKLTPSNTPNLSNCKTSKDVINASTNGTPCP